MKGGHRKTRKREPKKKPAETADFDSSPAAEESNVASGALSTCCQSPLSSLTSTPKRGNRDRRQTQRASLTSTPVHSLSDVAGSPPDVNEVQLQYTELIARSKTPAADSPCSNSKSQSKGRRCHASQPRQVQQGAAEEQTQTNGSTPKRKRGRPRKTETVDLKGKTSTQSSKRSRPRFELKEPDAAGQESWLSSDLSIELSHHKEPSLPFQEDEKSDEEEEEEEEEEDLPSFLMQMDKKPPCITEGAFVWCKYRYYPSWPALVKSVNRKQKKASILFIEDTSIQKKKGITVAQKTLKPFDCEEADELIRKAKETYDAAITWSLELIEDYRIRIACGSFSGTFIEYFNHDMSYPVRRKYPQAASERLTISSDDIKEDSLDEIKEDSLSEKNEDVCRSSKRLLPDRSHAAHNRANEKLVHFIVKQRMVERHLLAVIRGQQQSRWLRSFLSAKRRRVVNIYLEDDQQLDQVYWYLSELYATTVGTAPCLAEMKSMECVPFVLDVLLPEAIIYAIAGVDNVSVKKAEEKYLKGRCISNRERQEFDLMIERQMRKKSQRQNAALDSLSDAIN
ncbi:PWWP domain-containing DNA repair factor 3B-like isoform 2-T3 [Odontesthes bonariensis]|uniref:PWWP domain-containing DNA repair factor 3B-like isoform X2 n=1 Tax=Odontesthes bonariensis TaxID=219752 RepID=UPI003F58C4E4